MAKQAQVDTETALLKALSRRSGALVRCGDDYELAGSDGAIAINRRLVEEGLSSGSLVSNAGRVTLTLAGKNALRRALASHDEFRSQHQSRRFGDVTDASGREIVVALTDGTTPLGWLLSRKGPNGKPLISAAQLEAGERLARDYEVSCLGPRLTANWSAEVRQKKGRKYGGGSIGVATGTDLTSDAQSRVRAALTVVGPELSGILIDVCCHQQGLSDAERSQGFPQRSGKTVLGLALSALARHYRIPDDETLPRTSPSRLFWRDGDAVPDLKAWEDRPG